MSTCAHFSTVKKVIVVISAIVSLSCMGCGIEQASVSNHNLMTLQTQAADAYTSGSAAIMREPVLSVDEIWVLREILKIIQNEALQQFVTDKTASLGEHPFLRLIDPGGSRVDMPTDPDSGFTRFYYYVLAPFGKPEKRAISFINDFVATEESGYILTHQFLVLEWAKQTGLELPKKLRNKRKGILERMLQEQLADDSFSDLYAERAAILLRFKKPKAKDAANWIHTIVRSQLEDGNWGRFSKELTYDGQSSISNPTAAHTTSLSLLSLIIYLSDY
jgi:hypothetical protein